MDVFVIVSAKVKARGDARKRPFSSKSDSTAVIIITSVIVVVAVVVGELVVKRLRRNAFVDWRQNRGERFKAIC